MKNGEIDLSIIIPCYNTAAYLPNCLDSLIFPRDIRVEILIIDDGSTDESEAILAHYARRDSRVYVLRQSHCGASAARNKGLEMARGRYVAFLDSDDWIQADKLFSLFCEAHAANADMLLGGICLTREDGTYIGPYMRLPDTFPSELSGEEAFIWLQSHRCYLPSPVIFLYRRDFLVEQHAQFYEGIMHEDELWVPTVLCRAKRVRFSDRIFYCYRQHSASVMHATPLCHRLHSQFTVANALLEYASRFPDGDLKSLWYANLYRLYAWGFETLDRIRDSRVAYPVHQLDRYWIEKESMTKEAEKRCYFFWKRANEKRQNVVDWLCSDWVRTALNNEPQESPLCLVYNADHLLSDMQAALPGWIITNDRRNLQQATFVLFHLPTLSDELDSDLAKLEGQFWFCYYKERERAESMLEDPELLSLFDGMLMEDEQGNLACSKINNRHHMPETLKNIIRDLSIKKSI